MSSILIYHNPRWSKSRESVKILEKNNINFKIKQYLKEELTIEELENISKYLNKKPKDFIRTSETDFKALGLTNEELNNDYLVLKKILKYPKILERPIIVNKGQAVIGRPPEAILNIL